MFKKARVVVTVFHNPFQPFSMDDSPASNIHFGEMTRSHARRDRRRRRNARRRSVLRSPMRPW